MNYKVKKLLFFDAIAPYEYNFDILEKKGLGASESYLLSVASELKKNFDVDIATAKVRYNYVQNDVVFKKLDIKNLSDNYDTIIIQRNPQNLKVLKNKYPKANFIIWLHDFYESSLWASLPNHDLQYIIDNATLLCVSNWHKNNFEVNLKLRKIKNCDVKYIHFFIEDKNKISEKKVEYDKNKLCFFSAGHKGLDFTLKIFEQLYKVDPKFKLYIGNPTYDQKYDIDGNNGSVIYLGNQTRDQVLSHMQSSLATIHLNKNYPETFGCVNAESNMVGTPVCCYDIGATKEILYNADDQLIQPNPYRVDLHDVTHIIEKILRWQQGERTIVKLNPLFNKKIITEKWNDLI